MKKFISAVLALCISAGMTVSALAQDNIKVTVNNEQVVFDQQPVIKDGRTLVPLRAVLEKVGADVTWKENEQAIYVTKDGNKLILQIGYNQMYVFTPEIVGNFSNVALDVAPQIINDRTLLPIRAVCEALGMKVDWQEATQTVIINN